MGCCCCCCNKAKKKKTAKGKEREEGCCCYCIRRTCCYPCDKLGYKTEDRFAEKMNNAKVEELRTKHKARSFRLGSARVGVCINGLLGVPLWPFCILACSDKRQCTVVCDERRIVERAAQENHGIDLRKGENRVGRKRYLFLGGLVRLCVTAACPCVGELVSECAVSQVESCFECAAKAPLEGPGGDAGGDAAKTLSQTASEMLVEQAVQAAVKEKERSDIRRTPEQREERSDNKGALEQGEERQQRSPRARRGGKRQQGAPEPKRNRR